MKLHADRPDAANVIHAITRESVSINGTQVRTGTGSGTAVGVPVTSRSAPSGASVCDRLRASASAMSPRMRITASTSSGLTRASRSRNGRSTPSTLSPSSLPKMDVAGS